METRQNTPVEKADEAFYLGSVSDAAYYFFYKKDSITHLDWEFLHTIKTKAEQYVIYADICTLSKDELDRMHITFKKIPRDIARL